MADEPDPRRWHALAVCLVGGFMVLLDVSIVNVALPSIETGLSAKQSELQWVVSGYALTFGLLLVPAGRLGDLRGRRSMFVFALAAFTLASALCGAAQSSTWLVLARLAQGLAGGMLTPQISASIQELFSGAERGKAFGLFGATVGLSTAIGPLLGGLLIAAFGDTEGWRWVFYVNVPIGLAAMPLAWRLLPPADEAKRRRRHTYDPVGVLLLGSGAVLLLLPFVQSREWSGASWLLVPVAVVVLGVFLWWEFRYTRGGKEPLVDLTLFQRPSYTFGISLITIYFAGFTALFFVFTLYMQIGLHYSALAAGLAMTPFALGSGVASALGGRVVTRVGRPLVAAGLLLVAVGFAGTIVAVHAVPDNGTGWATFAPLLVAGVGGGLVIAPNQALTLSDVPVQRAGTAGGLLQTGQRLGAAIGIAAVGSAFFGKLADSDGDFAAAYERGVTIMLCFIVGALAIAAADILHGRRVDRRNDDGTHRIQAGTTAA